MAMGAPAPVNPNSTPEQVRDRVAFENSVNEAVEAHLASWREAVTLAFLDGHSVELIVHEADEPEADADEVKPYAAWTKAELEEECETRGLAKSGTKDELILRLSNEDAEAAAESADDATADDEGLTPKS